MLKIDKIDKKILLELDLYPRSSFNQIAKKARISKEIAQYRFKQLQKNKILTGFFAFVNVSALGYDTSKILIKYKSVNSQINDNIIAFLKKSKIVAWAANTEGRWDLIITTISPSKKEFFTFYTNFFKEFGLHFKEKELLLSIDNLVFNEKYLSEGKLLCNKKLSLDLSPKKIDETDLKIIKEISMNSRQSFTEIGEKINLSYWAISRRYSKLIKEKFIIVLKPRIDFRKLGYEYYHFLIELNNVEAREKIEKYYTSHPDCIMIMNHAGAYSMHLEFVLKKEKMKNILLEFREKFGENITSYEPLLINEEYVMNLLKN